MIKFECLKNIRLLKRGEVYHVQYTLKGKMKRKSTGETTEKKAIAYVEHHLLPFIVCRDYPAALLAIYEHRKNAFEIEREEMKKHYGSLIEGYKKDKALSVKERRQLIGRAQMVLDSWEEAGKQSTDLKVYKQKNGKILIDDDNSRIEFHVDDCDRLIKLLKNTQKR